MIASEDVKKLDGASAGETQAKFLYTYQYIYRRAFSLHSIACKFSTCLAACPENRIKDVKMWARVLLQWDFTRTAIQVVTEFCKP